MKTNNKDKMIEEQVTKFADDILNAEAMGHTIDYRVMLTDFGTTLLTKHEEAVVERERVKWISGTLIAQFISIEWDGEKITEKYLDDPEEDLDSLIEEITNLMQGKYKGSYSVKVVRSYCEGQMSHPETGQWDFPPYYEIDSMYYLDNAHFLDKTNYKPLALTPDNPTSNNK